MRACQVDEGELNLTFFHNCDGGVDSITHGKSIRSLQSVQKRFASGVRGRLWSRPHSMRSAPERRDVDPMVTGSIPSSGPVRRNFDQVKKKADLVKPVRFSCTTSRYNRPVSPTDLLLTRSGARRALCFRMSEGPRERAYGGLQKRGKTG